MRADLPGIGQAWFEHGPGMCYWDEPALGVRKCLALKDIRFSSDATNGLLSAVCADLNFFRTPPFMLSAARPTRGNEFVSLIRRIYAMVVARLVLYTYEQLSKQNRVAAEL